MAAPPEVVLAITKPAVLKVVLQLLPAEHLAPLGQHWRGLVAAVLSPDSVTVTGVPSAAAAWVSVVVATPLLSNLTVVLDSAPALVDNVAVSPLAPV